MAILTDFTIENDRTNKQFSFRGCQMSRMRMEQPSQPLPIVDAQPQNNVLFRFTGQTREIGCTFRLFDNGVDVANGTHTSTVITVQEQIRYLYDSTNGIYTEEFDDGWSLTDVQGEYYSGTISGNLEFLEVTKDEDSFGQRIGEFLFRQGRTGSLGDGS